MILITDIGFPVWPRDAVHSAGFSSATVTNGDPGRGPCTLLAPTVRGA